MPSIADMPLFRPTHRIATRAAMGFLATMTTVVASAYPDGSIFAWDLAAAPAKPSVRSSANGLDHALFRTILQDPQHDSESFWDRDRRWTETLKMNDARSAPISLQGSGDSLSDVHFSNWIAIPELSLALAPFTLGGGLLLLRRKSVPAGICSA